jgi:hypothetical protein
VDARAAAALAAVPCFLDRMKVEQALSLSSEGHEKRSAFRAELQVRCLSKI